MWHPIRTQALTATSSVLRETCFGGYARPVTTHQTTSWTLVLDAAEGAPEARSLFVARYEPALRRYIAARWRLPLDHEHVLDATQEAVLECLKDGGALSRVDADRSSGFRAFLFGVARHVALRQEEQRRRGAVTPILPEHAPVDERRLSAVFDGAFAEILVSEALELMCVRRAEGGGALQSELLDMNYVQGLPAREIAVRLQIEVTRVYKLLHAARRDFRAALLDVMRSQHPEKSDAELEDEMHTLLGELAE